MFVMNNIHDRSYRDIYTDISNVIFDIFDKQLRSQKNADWHHIKTGDIVCVIRSTRRISTFYRVIGKEASGLVDSQHGASYVLLGEVIAKAQVEQSMQSLFNRYGVRHPYLPNNQFSIGFNVANIGDALDALPVRSRQGATLGEVAGAAA